MISIELFFSIGIRVSSAITFETIRLEESIRSTPRRDTKEDHLGHGTGRIREDLIPRKAEMALDQSSSAAATAWLMAMRTHRERIEDLTIEIFHPQTLAVPLKDKLITGKAHLRVSTVEIVIMGDPL